MWRWIPKPAIITDNILVSQAFCMMSERSEHI